MKRNGWTLIELLVVLVAIAAGALCIGAIYVLVHLTVKFW